MTSRLLLDTCALIWMVEEAPLSEASIAAMNDAFSRRETVFVSPISAWEYALLVAKGRLASPMPPKTWFDRAVKDGSLCLAPLSPDILADASFLPGSIHKDPADRIIISTARALDMIVVTRDDHILRYAALGHVRALAC